MNLDSAVPSPRQLPSGSNISAVKLLLLPWHGLVAGRELNCFTALTGEPWRMQNKLIELLQLV